MWTGALAMVLLAVATLTGCGNSPWPSGQESRNVMFNSFEERSPRYLDPVASYSNPESVYTFQIYEPLYQYHYVKRPYELQPRTAQAVVEPYYVDAAGKRLPQDAPADQIAESIYEIAIKPGIRYAPHPALAVDAQGKPRYLSLAPDQLANKRSPLDFEHQGTRELVAEDYVYNLKRHATPRIETPIYGIFSEYVVGLKAYRELIAKEDKKLLEGLPEDVADKPFLDFRKWPLEGVTAIDKYTLRMRIKGKYPQWKYWLAMVFTAPLPWEADAFYAQAGMSANSLSLNQWPVGTGAFMMTEYVQDRRHVMTRNPNFRGEAYPCDGNAGDKEAGWLADCGKPMPFVDEIVSVIIKERTPRKEMFKQGYLDVPEIERPEWGVILRADADDSDAVKAAYAQRGFQFPQTADMNNWYLGFNMLDPVVGKGATPQEVARNRKLRHAISIAIDWEEGYGQIFKHKGGDAAHGPIPPGVFGSREGTPAGHNPITHRVVAGKVERRPIEEAHTLMAAAGYPNGRDATSGKPLVLNYDFQRALTPEFRAENDWLVKQFAKLGIQLEIRATDFNQFQDKVNKGKHQIYWAGWLADYPDAENFLFLLYGPNSKAVSEGENLSNYQNASYDTLYKALQTLDDGPQKQAAMDAMLAVVREDAPWSFGFWAWAATANQQWVHNAKPGIVIRDMARYYRVDPVLRARKQAEWNQPVWWPVALLGLGLLLLAWLAQRSFTQRELATATAQPAMDRAPMAPAAVQ
jgi:ABC-type transport system substrate-binding protein